MHKQQHRPSDPTVLHALRKQLPASLPSTLDQHALEKIKEQALRKAKAFKKQVGEGAKESLQNARLAAADIAASKSAGDAGRKVGRLVHEASNSWLMLAFSRMLVCCYFINSAYDTYGRWDFMNQQANFRPQQYSHVSFPWFSMAVLLPCAVLAALGAKVLVTGTVLLLYEIYDSFNLVWAQMSMFVLYGYRPNELVVKRLAMVGCAALVLANSIKQSKAINSYAGLLVSGDSKEPSSRKKSAVLLLGRLLMTSLFIYVGLVQIQRVVARDFVLFAHVPHSAAWARDGHDNNWLLLEFLFSLPFAVGYHTGLFARLLAASMAMEAVTCWPVWAEWPTPAYSMHVRLHFVTNMAVSGGLLLLANFGAGRYTVDAFINKKKE